MVTLSPNTVYTLSVTGVTDLTGVVAINPPVNTSFTTGATVDFLAPLVTSVTPANGATNIARSTSIQLQFNKPINPLTITTGTFIVSVSSGGNVAGTISLASDGKSATFTPQSSLVPLTTHNVQISGAADLGGQLIASFQANFTTGI